MGSAWRPMLLWGTSSGIRSQPEKDPKKVSTVGGIGDEGVVYKRFLQTMLSRLISPY